MAVNLVSAPFVDALARGEIVYQHCPDCGAAQRLARYACVHCGGARLEWRPAGGEGTVFAVTVVSRAPSEEFRELAPYGIALVDLDEGARLMGHAPVDLRIGERVRAEVFALGTRRLVRFRRLAPAGGRGPGETR